MNDFYCSLNVSYNCICSFKGVIFLILAKFHLFLHYSVQNYILKNACLGGVIKNECLTCCFLIESWSEAQIFSCGNRCQIVDVAL